MSVADCPPVGALVNVTRGIGETEKALAQTPHRIYIVEGYTRPHGYARIKRADAGFDAGSWLVHPEALERIEQ